MNRLHLSDRTYTAQETTRALTDPRAWPVGRPACGSDDSSRCLLRGDGPALVPARAISAEYHCPECVRAIQGGCHAER